MKLPQFLAKLSSKQIYGIFAFATVLFVIIGFVVAQNIQNYGKNSASFQTNSQSSNTNSATNSSNDFKKSSQNSVSNSNLNANSSSSESQNPYFINNSKNSQSQDSDQNLQKRYFKGKIGDLPIRMVLELNMKAT